MEEAKKKTNVSKRQVAEFAKDAGWIVASAFFIALAYHVFIIPNGFAPGGVGGIATMIGYVLKIPASIFILALNLPLCLAVFFAVNKKTGAIISIFIILQSGMLQLIELFAAELIYKADNIILAALAGAVVCAVGSASMLKRFGALNGTFAISMLVRKKYPTYNAVWLSFGMDCAVVAASFFVYGRNLDPVLYTFINLYVGSKIIDAVLQGGKSAFKYEIFTERPKELAAEIIDKIKHGVSLIHATGMYTNEPRNLLVCVVRRRDVAEFYKILRANPDAFAYITQVSEVVGYFK